jgi:hypothetical protein
MVWSAGSAPGRRGSFSNLRLWTAGGVCRDNRQHGPRPLTSHPLGKLRDCYAGDALTAVSPTTIEALRSAIKFWNPMIGTIGSVRAWLSRI